MEPDGSRPPPCLFLPDVQSSLSPLKRLLRNAGCDRVLLITDPGAWVQIGRSLKKELGRFVDVDLSAPVLTNKWLRYGSAFRNGSSAAPFVVGMGGCTVLDVSRAFAHRAGASYVLFPTILSTNCIHLNQAVIFMRGMNRTFSVRRALAVFLVPSAMPPGRESLTREYRRYTVGSFGELAANVSAAFDWRLAASVRKDRVDGLALAAGLRAFRRGCRFLRAADPEWMNDPRQLKRYARILMASGQAAHIHGTDRPLSGAEHKIYHALVRQNGRLLATHGEVVGVASRLILFLYREASDILPAAVRPLVRQAPIAGMTEVMKQVGFPVRGRDLLRIGLDRETLYRAMRFARKVKPERYTILEHIAGGKGGANPLEPLCRRAIERLFHSAG